MISALASVDEWLLRAARTYGHNPQAERVVARFSRVGEHAAVWLAIGAGGMVLDSGRRERWRGATTKVLATYALNTAIKQVVRRRRPQLAGLGPLTDTPTQLSFPSAHSATSFAGAFAYSQLGLPRTPLYALAVGLALSRLYLGVHYPSDVLAGAALGTALVGST
jgi:membrane-associated phospholipid phosphatase